MYKHFHILLLIFLVISIFSHAAFGGGINTKLQEAASSGRAKEVNELIKQGADIGASNDYDDSALSLAKKKGHTEIISIILDTIKKRKE